MKMKTQAVIVMAIAMGVIATQAEYIPTVDNCDTYPSGGSGWVTDWNGSYTTQGSDGSVISVSETSVDYNYFRRKGGSFFTGDNAGITAVFRFDYTMGSDLSALDSTGDELTITHQGSSTASGASSSSFWIMRAYGAAGVNGLGAREISFFDGTSGVSDGWDTSKLSGTGMTLEADTTYSFTITSDMAAGTFDYLIDNGTTTVSGSGLGFRSDFQNGGAFTATSLLFASNMDSAGDAFGYAIDNVSIIPEPATLGLVGSFGVALMFVRRRFLI